ncbi:hypothetical protein KUL42_32460 [Alteromonas sp. KUL42]|uniref:hypothetical protein n=1 Tax=Alteromonas sp. KUL42 TaxID=2480797 RepID=UPI001036AF77|nr:hypothetical protein [Alteromonas sp. KUL42]TAP33266.1 hypothetical protein EYR97_15290 [Alteromonas sp. KUL42]GEA08485.1 hypothetical protein KUL42_32460 [Alteromonas sp. KUL42]
MSVKITFIENVFDKATWEVKKVDDVNAFLASKFSQFPSTGRIYHEQISENNDITPRTVKDIARLNTLDGHIYIVIYPGDPITVIFAVVAVVSAVVAFTMDVPNPALKNNQQTSPNNELSSRSNRERINARVADIFGTVRSTPDMIAPAYKVFENHLEVEHAYMSVGRGEYEIPDNEVKDDTTRILDIPGASVQIYKPFTSPNSGHSPQLIVGNAINEPIFAAKRNNAVNGQVLRAPNSNSLNGNNDIKFTSLGQIVANPSSEIDFTTKFEAGDSIQISNAIFNAPPTGSSEGQFTRSVSFLVRLLHMRQLVRLPIQVVQLELTVQSLFTMMEWNLK